MTPEAIALLCLGSFSAGLWAATFVLQRMHVRELKRKGPGVWRPPGPSVHTHSRPGRVVSE